MSNPVAELLTLRTSMSRARREGPKAHPDRLRRLFALLGDLGLKERGDRLLLASFGTGRNVETFKDLWAEEAEKLIGWLADGYSGMARREAGEAARRLLRDYYDLYAEEGLETLIEKYEFEAFIDREINSAPPLEPDGGAAMDELLRQGILQKGTKGDEMEVPQEEYQAVMDETLGEVLIAPEKPRCKATTFLLIKGIDICLTMEEGATAEGAEKLLREMGKVTSWAKDKLGAVPILGVNARETLAGYQAPPSPAPQPAPQPVGGTPPPAAPQEAGGELRLRAVKVTSTPRTDGKAEVGFYRKGDKFAEVRYWAFPDDLVAAFAPVAQFEPIHFEKAGEWALSCDVIYSLSEKTSRKGNPYKDFVRVESAT